MMVDRYDPMCLFDVVLQLELEMEPELAELNWLLDDHTLFQQARPDLARRVPLPLAHGRYSTPVELILRMLVVCRLYPWRNAATEHVVSGSLVLRQFCRPGFERAQDISTLIRWAGLIRPETLEHLNKYVVAFARQLRVTRGRKRRTNGTVVEATIHHPSDSSRLIDGVHALGRMLGRAKGVAGDAVGVAQETLAQRLQDLRRPGQETGETVRRRGEEVASTRQEVYRRLRDIAEASLANASRLLGHLGEGMAVAELKLGEHLGWIVPLVEQVVDQTARRVPGRETVPAADKLVSLARPHPAIIIRGKTDRVVEDGRGSEAPLGSTKWAGETLAASRSWAAIPPTPRISPRPWLTIRRSSAIPPTYWPATAGCISPRTSISPRCSGSSRCACPSRGRSPPTGRHTNTRSGSGEDSGFGRGSKGGSACCADATISGAGGAKVGRALDVGSALASSKRTRSPSPAPLPPEPSRSGTMANLTNDPPIRRELECIVCPFRTRNKSWEAP